MTDACALRKVYSKDLANLEASQPRLGPAPEIVEMVTLPGGERRRMRFKLTKRQGHWLEYTATCPRCRDETITVETTMGSHGRELWPPVKGFPQLGENCEEEPVPLIKQDAIWDGAISQQKEQLKEQRRRAAP